MTIFEVWVQKTSTLVKKRIAKITEPICLWSPVTKVQVPWGCISFCLLFVNLFFLISCCQTIDKYCTWNNWFFSIFWESCIIFSRETNYEHGAKFPLSFLVFKLIVLEKIIYIYIYVDLSLSWNRHNKLSIGLFNFMLWIFLISKILLYEGLLSKMRSSFANAF